MFNRTTTMLALLAATAVPALAVKTQFFTHGTREAFETGTLESLVATNFGELRLARSVQTILADEGTFASIDAMIEAPDGTVYVGTTASGKLLAIRDGKAATVADYGEASSVSALAVDADGTVLIGVSGDQAKLFQLKRGATQPEPIVDVPDAQYIWSVAVDPRGPVYLGTGPEGHLVAVDRAAKTSRVVYDSDEDNLRAVALVNDSIFVGTDPNGLVLKIDSASGKAFVVYDAPETEVSSLLLDTRNGHIYAATSQLVEGAADPEEPAAEPGASVGRPSSGPSDAGIAHEPGDPPAPPRPAPGPTPSPTPGPGQAATPGELQAADVPAPQADPEREAGGPTTQGANAPAASTSPAGPQPTSRVDAAGEAAANGNAVYRIDSQGFVSEVFRAPVMIFGLARQEEQLFIATGPAGTLYQLDLANEEHVAIARTRSQSLTSVLSTQDGRLFLGSNASAEVSMLAAGQARTGTFTSPVLDASQIAAFGKLQVRGNVPEGTSMQVSTRSGNVADERSPMWSEWSAPVPAARFVQVQTPNARYVQYRLTLAGDGRNSPLLDEVTLAYQQPNVAPRIDSVTVETPAAEGEDAPNPARQITWSSTEPNGDELVFTVLLRAGGADSPWVPLAKDLKEATYAWDTRRVADGRYEVRIEASDARANAPGTEKVASRVSDPILIDNTPPAIGDVKVTREGPSVTVAVRVADRSGVVASLEYAIDGAEHWQTVLPSDMLNDSPDEQYVIALPDPGPATRVVSLRSRDESGNTAHESVTIRPLQK